MSIKKRTQLDSLKTTLVAIWPTGLAPALLYAEAGWHRSPVVEWQKSLLAVVDVGRSERAGRTGLSSPKLIKSLARSAVGKLEQVVTERFFYGPLLVRLAQRAVCLLTERKVERFRDSERTDVKMKRFKLKRLRKKLVQLSRVALGRPAVLV